MPAPILRILLPLIFGILLAERLVISPLYVIAAATVLTGLVLTLEFVNRKYGEFRWKRHLQMAFIYAAVACLGTALATIQTPSEYLPIPPDGATMSLRINDIPVPSEHSVKASATIDWIKDAGERRQAPGGTKVMIFAEKSSKSTGLSYGDRIIVHGSLRLPSDDKGQHQFNYRRHLKHKGILYQTYLHDEQYETVAHSRRGLFCTIFGLRMHLIDIVQNSPLSNTQKGIAEALMLGWKHDIDPATGTQFRDAGVMHLLCVSGLHVGIIVAIIGACLFFLPANPRMRLVKGIVQLTGVWFFVLMTGMAPATLRAGVMFTFIIVGKISSSQTSTLNSVAASALVLLLAHPSILFDIGFQFSYSAVIGIVLFNKPLYNIIQFPSRYRHSNNMVLATVNKIWLYLMKELWGLVSVSTVAELASLPFVLYHFHRLPVYFLISNVTIIPFAGAMLATIMLFLAFSWWPVVFDAIGHLLQWELTATDLLTRWVAQLPHAVIENICFPASLAALSIVFIVLLALAIHRRPSHIAKLLMACTFLFFVADVALITLRHSQQQVITVYSLGKASAIEFINGRNSVLLLCDNANNITVDNLDYQTSGNLAHYGVRHRACIYLHDTAENATTTPVCYASENHKLLENMDLAIVGSHIQFGKLHILIADRHNGHILRQYVRGHLPERFPKPIDYLMLCGNTPLGIAELQQLYDFKNVVISSSNSTRNSVRWQRECDSLRIPCHFIAREGALSIEM